MARKLTATANVDRGAKTVVVRSRLPYGLTLQLGRRTVTLNGLNSNPVIGASFASTEIDADFWRDWSVRNAKSKVLTNRVIFAADENSANSIVKDSPRTGLEAADPAEDGLAVATGD